MLTTRHMKMTPLAGRFLLATLMALASAGVVRAQITEDPPVLPDLAPREVEIRGQLQIAFPSLQRQPLVGFNPPPRVPEIPLTRRPFIEDYADAGANFLRANLNPPEPPGVTALTGEGPLRAEVELSAGRFFQRRIHALAAARMRSNQKVEIRLRYLGSDGDDVGFQDASNKNDDFAGSLAYERALSGVTVGARVEGFASSYSLYGLDTTGTSGRIDLNPDRTTRSADESVWISSAPRAAFDYRLEVGLRQTRIESDLFATQLIRDPGTERSERRAYVDVEAAVPVGSGEGLLQGRFETAGLDEGGLAGSDVKLGQVAAGYRYESETITIEGAPALIAVSFDGQLGGQPGETRSASYLSPHFDLRLRTGQRVVFFARNEPGVRANDLRELFSENAYLVTEPRMQPTIQTIDARSGIAIFSGPIQIKAEAAVERSPNWRYFVTSTGSGAATVNDGFFDAAYGDGQIISIGGEMSLSLPAELQLSAAAYYHDSELTDLDVRIPHQPRLSGRAGVSYPFASTRGLLQATGTYIGSRYVDINEEVELDAYLDIDLYARYNVSRAVGIVLRLDNIAPANNEVWGGYEQSRFVLSGGVRLLW